MYVLYVLYVWYVHYYVHLFDHPSIFLSLRPSIHPSSHPNMCLKDISIVSEIRKLHSIFKEQQYKRNNVREFSDNKKSCRKPLDMEKVELKLDKDLEESLNEEMVI